MKGEKPLLFAPSFLRPGQTHLLAIRMLCLRLPPASQTSTLMASNTIFNPVFTWNRVLPDFYFTFAMTSPIPPAIAVLGRQTTPSCSLRWEKKYLLTNKPVGGLGLKGRISVASGAVGRCAWYCSWSPLCPKGRSWGSGRDDGGWGSPRCHGTWG